MKTKQTKKEFMIITIDSEEGNMVVGKVPEKFMEKTYKRTQDRANISYSLTIRTADNAFRFGAAKCKALEGYDFVLVSPFDDEDTARVFGHIESYEFLDAVLQLTHKLGGQLDLKYGMTQAAKLEPESIEIFKRICDKYVPKENMKIATDLAKQIKIKN